MAYGGNRSRWNSLCLGHSVRKEDKKYVDGDRARFCKETTYAAEYRNKNSPVNNYNKQIDNQIVSKYSNRIPKSAKASSVDRTKHHRDHEHYKTKYSKE
jgi:hypothetical protein